MEAAVQTIIDAFAFMLQHRADYPRFDESLKKDALKQVVIEPHVLNEEGTEFPFLVARTKEPGRVTLLINGSSLKDNGYLGHPDKLVPLLAREFQWVVSKADTAPKAKPVSVEWRTATRKRNGRCWPKPRRSSTRRSRWTATCVLALLPVFVGHSEAVERHRVEKPMTVEEARSILREAPGIVVVDKREPGGYVTPVDAAGEFATYVSRIREKRDGGERPGAGIVSRTICSKARLSTRCRSPRHLSIEKC